MTQKARKGRPHLGLQVEVLCQHPHVHRGRVTHGLRRLVESFVWYFPIQGPHLQEVVQYFVVQRVPIQHQQILVRTDHVHPQDIIMMKIEEAIPPPPLFDHELVLSLLSWEANTVGATIEDL